MNIAIPSDNLKALDILRFQARFVEVPGADTGSEERQTIQDKFIADNSIKAESRSDGTDSAIEAGGAESKGLLKEADSSACAESGESGKKEGSGTELTGDKCNFADASKPQSPNVKSSVPEVLSMEGGPLFSVSLKESGANYQHSFLYFATEPQENAQKEPSPPAEGADKSTPVRRAAARSASKRVDPMGEKEEAALKEELQLQDELRANEIYERMKIDRQIHEAKLQAMLADLQTELQRIWREAALRRRKMEDDLSKSWQKAVLGV